MSQRLQSLWARSQGRAGVVSPCLSVCRIDVATGYCAGCWRSLDEIAAWPSLSDDAKRRVWAALLQRQAAALQSESREG